MRQRPLLLALLAAACGSAPPAPAARSAAPATPPAPPADDASPTQLTDAELARDAALAPRAEAFANAFANQSPLLLRDGRVLFVSTRDGLPALFVGDAAHPEAAPRKLPDPGDRVVAPRLLPDEQQVLFASDVHGNQDFAIWRVGVDGSGLTNLTPDAAMHRDPPVVASRAPGGRFAYAAHTATDPTAHVFVQEGDGPPREVYADAASGYVVDLSADGKSLLFSRFLSENEQVLFVVNVVFGKATRLYPPEGEHAKLDARFAADGNAVFVASEAPGRSARLLLLDAKGRERARYEESAAPAASIAGIQVSPTGDRIAIALDAGDHSEVRLLDARTLRGPRTAAIGLGSASLGRFRSDGARLPLTLTASNRPTDIVSLDPTTGTVTPLRADPRPGLDGEAPPAASIVRVTAFDGLAISVGLFLPAGAAAGQRLPTLVLIHGGPSGSAPVAWNPTIGFWTAMGFAVVQPNIRGSTGFGLDFERADDREKRGDALRDVESVNRWARAQPWCDPDRLVIGGISYGGYMTLLALTRQPDLWRAGIDGSGMSDLRTMEKLEDQTIRVYDETEFGVLGAQDDLLAAWSPLADAGKIVAPVFIYQGANDPVTPQREADQIVAALRAHRVPVEYMLLADEGHGIVRRENYVAYLARSCRFVTDHLAAAPPPAR